MTPRLPRSRPVSLFLSAVALAAAGGASVSAFALPSLEDPAALAALGRGETPAIVFNDDADPYVKYVPYDKVEITRDASGRPAFSFVYNEAGGLMNFMVNATYSPERAATIADLKARGYTVKPLAPISGGWNLTIASSDTSFFAGVTPKVETVLPDVPVALSIQLKRESVAYVVHALSTGANVGVNYTYTFRGVLTPFRMRASVNYELVNSAFKEHEQKFFKACDAGASIIGDNSANAKACHFSPTDIRTVTQNLVERQVIKITSTSTPDTPEYARQIQEITNLITGRMFKPSATLWSANDSNVPDASVVCEAGGEGAFDASCTAMAASLQRLEANQYENRSLVVEITSQGIQKAPAAVGFSLGYICEKHPELVRYTGGANPASNGCPTQWDEGGIKTPALGAPPVAPLRPGAPDLGAPIFTRF